MENYLLLLIALHLNNNNAIISNANLVQTTVTLQVLSSLTINTFKEKLCYILHKYANMIIPHILDWLEEDISFSSSAWHPLSSSITFSMLKKI